MLSALFIKLKKMKTTDQTFRLLFDEGNVLRRRGVQFSLKFYLFSKHFYVLGILFPKKSEKSLNDWTFSNSDILAMISRR